MYYNSIPCRIVVSKLSLIPLLYAIWHFMPAWKIPLWLTSCSFAVYVLHELFFTHISLAFQKLNLAEENSPLQAIVKFVVGFLGSIALTLLIRRFLPRTARTLFGGR